MPLTENALEYWDDYSGIAEDIDWSNIRANYNPGFFMQPEYMAFSHDGAQLLVNLQQNSALVRVDLRTATAQAVDGFGLKPWNVNGIDIIDSDKSCNKFITNPFLYSNRKPDVIASAEIDGVNFVFTADEGSDDDYGPYEEKMEVGNLLLGTTLGLRSFSAISESFFSTVSSTQGATALFNSDCPDNGLESFCANGLEISIGSDAVNFSNPIAPVLEKIVALGGRGIGIYKVPPSYDDEIEFIWDSVRFCWWIVQKLVNF